MKQMQVEPYSGDTLRLTGRPYWRRRVGEYRIVFSVSDERQLIMVEQIARRTTQSYERLP